jgi:hypothetical protein
MRLDLGKFLDGVSQYPEARFGGRGAKQGLPTAMPKTAIRMITVRLGRYTARRAATPL